MEEAPAFEAWVLARRRALLRTAWLLTGDVAAAEDLVQVALLKCWPRWARISGMADIDGYVRRVLVTSHVSSRRRHWHGEVSTGELPEPVVDAEPRDLGELLVALARLPRGQRAVVVLRFAEDLSEAQTAAVLGISRGTVKSQTSRALRTLRVDPALREEHEGEPWTSRT